ncbi:MAG TPA: hypothetical protein VHM64_22665 [Candidatus Binatia bacterium]|nr:hypothetical protein [Candidatus Binatia bacterium]
MRKSFAVLLIGSWIGLSGIDSLQADKLPSQVDLQLSGGKSQPSGDSANKLRQSPYLAVSYQPAIYESTDFRPRLCRFAAHPKTGRIYKIHRVFLI